MINKIPTELSKLIREDAEFKAAWNKLAPSHKSEYLKWINQAQKKITKESRIQKTVVLVKKKNTSNPSAA